MLLWSQKKKYLIFWPENNFPELHMIFYFPWKQHLQFNLNCLKIKMKMPNPSFKTKIKIQMPFLKSEPSRHITLIQQCHNVYATSWRCINVVVTLYNRHVPTGKAMLVTFQNMFCYYEKINQLTMLLYEHLSYQGCLFQHGGRKGSLLPDKGSMLIQQAQAWVDRTEHLELVETSYISPEGIHTSAILNNTRHGNILLHLYHHLIPE